MTVRLLAATVLATGALAAPAAAAQVQALKPCYVSAGEEYESREAIELRGTGFTPNGDVRLALERASGDVLEETSEPVADQQGVVSGGYKVDDETGWFGSTQTRFDMTLRLTDRTDPTLVATTSFIFSRWNVGLRTVGGKFHPKRPASLHVIGYTGFVAKPIYAHWMRNGKRVFTKRLGVLRAPCGDLKTRLSRGFPFRPVPAGSYQVRFTPSRTDTKRAAIALDAVRVARRIP